VAVPRNDHYREAEVLVQPSDTPRGQEALDADLSAAAQIPAMLAVADQLAETVVTLRSLIRVQEERLRYPTN
jgi:hypothetical protein